MAITLFEALPSDDVHVSSVFSFLDRCDTDIGDPILSLSCLLGSFVILLQKMSCQVREGKLNGEIARKKS